MAAQNFSMLKATENKRHLTVKRQARLTDFE
jgi:hypothetical protein